MSQTLKNIAISGGKTKKTTNSKKVMKLKKSKPRKVNLKRTKKNVRRYKKKAIKGGDGVSTAIPVYYQDEKETLAHKVAEKIGINKGSCATMSDSEYADLSPLEKTKCAGTYIGRRIGDATRMVTGLPGTALKGTAAFVGNTGKALYNSTRSDENMFRPNEHFQYVDTFNTVSRDAE